MEKINFKIVSINMNETKGKSTSLVSGYDHQLYAHSFIHNKIIPFLQNHFYASIRPIKIDYQTNLQNRFPNLL